MKSNSLVIFSLPTVLVLLTALQIVTGNVGSCSFHMYFYKTRATCEIPFYRRLQLGLITNCSNNFETLISCIKNVTRVCEDSWRSDEWIDRDIRWKFRKQFYCKNGALLLPLALCGDKYYKKGPQCVRSFHRKFRRNITDPSLCDEYSEAKNCIKALLNEACPEKGNSQTPHMDVLFDEYNPFCKNRIYQPPTTVTMPSRKHQQNTKQPKGKFKTTPQRDIVAKDSASCNRIHIVILLLIFIALLCLFLI